jgi:hypothetical protein
MVTKPSATHPSNRFMLSIINARYTQKLSRLSVPDPNLSILVKVSGKQKKDGMSGNLPMPGGQ